MPNANLRKLPPSETLRPRKPMTEEQKQAARERMALARAAKGQSKPDTDPIEVEPLPAPDPLPYPGQVSVSPRTLGRLQCLLDAKDFNFIDHDDLIAWLLRQAGQNNKTAAFHLNMRYQRERAEIL